MRKVVLPIDFSENASNALRYAVALFSEPTHFYPFHVDSVNLMDLEIKKSADTDREQSLKKCKEKLDEMVAGIKQRFPNTDHRFETLVGNSYLLDELKDIISEKEIDLVVMGTRGATNDRNITFGSHTLQVLKQVSCPVLCIPEGFEFIEPKRLLFPTNFMIPYKDSEIDLVSEISNYYKGELHILHISKFGAISKRQRENQEKLTHQLNMENIHFHQVFENDDHKATAINEHIEDLHIDLLVMVNSRYTFLENLLHRSTIDKIGLHPKIPFLILQN